MKKCGNTAAIHTLHIGVSNRFKLGSIYKVLGKSAIRIDFTCEFNMNY